MCTLSFSPTRSGLLLAMNRDETLQRELANAPRLFSATGCIAAYPTEPSGGTWLALNDRGMILALLNKNSPTEMKKEFSRGTLIPSLIHSDSLRTARSRLETMDLEGRLPFTLVMIGQHERRLVEAVWNGHRLQHGDRPWATRHWFSSSVSDDDATRVRGRTCEVFHKYLVLSPESLRELHRSHSPGPGAFSICMHRTNATSVSYSEIRIDGDEAAFSYAPDSPCLRRPFTTLALPLRGVGQPVVARASGY